MSNIIQSTNFTLVQDQSAFGTNYRLIDKGDFTHIFLIQKTNEWFAKQWDPALEERNQLNLLFMLECAYEKGVQITLRDIKRALGIK